MEVARRVDLESYHDEKKIFVAMVMDVTGLIMVIILQFIKISNHYVIYLKLIQCYVNCISIFKKPEKKELYECTSCGKY